MATEITIPRLGWSMEEGTFVEWLKQDGEVVTVGEPLFALESDKALQEIEAVDVGILYITPHGPKPGDVVSVGAVVGYILQDQEQPPVLKEVAPKVASRQAEPKPAPQPGSTPHTERSTPRISPRALRIAQAKGIDWTQLQGTGRTGRIRERDVLNAVGSESMASTLDVSGTLRPVSSLRRTIARRLQASARETVPVTLTTKLNAESLAALRDRLKREMPDRVPSYGNIIACCAATLLKDCPELNACWRDDGLYLYSEINIAFAVDTDTGLMVPVIRDADRLPLTELSRQTKELARLAREGRLTPQQASGGTLTITNLGMFDIDAFTPIISPQQSAVLGIGRLVDEPVVRDGQIVIGKTLTLSLTFDHRVLDGAPAARWLQQLSHCLQQLDCGISA